MRRLPVAFIALAAFVIMSAVIVVFASVGNYEAPTSAGNGAASVALGNGVGNATPTPTPTATPTPSPTPSPTPTPCGAGQVGSMSRSDPSAVSAGFSGLPAAAGDEQVVLVGTKSVATFTAPANFAQIDYATGGGGAAATYLATTSLAPSGTFTASTGTTTAVIAGEYRNVGAVDVHSLVGITNSIALSTAVTPTATNDLFLFYAMNGGANTISGLTTGFAENALTGGAVGANWAMRDFFLLNPALASQQPQVTFASNTQERIGYVALLSACAGPTPTPTPSPTPTATPTPTPTPAPTPTPGAAPFVVQGPATASNVALSTTLVLSLAGAPANTSGHYMTAIVSLGNSAATITPPAGWSAAVDARGIACRALNSAGQQGIVTFIKAVGSGDSAGPYTFTFSGVASDWYAGEIVELGNISATTPIEQCGGAINSNGTTTGISPALTITTAYADLPLVGYSASTSGLTTTPQSGWAATVANSPARYTTLDVESHIPFVAGSTVSPQTTFSGFIGSIVFLPNVHTEFVPLGVTLPTPSPTPTAATCCTNGTEWPASFAPYASTSPWNLHITNTSTPTLLTNSDTIIANMSNTGGGAGPAVHTAEQGGGAGYGHPVYFTTTVDPTPTPQCRIYCAPPGFPSPINIAPRSRPVDGSDHHMVEVGPDGTENAAWEVAQNGASSGTVAHDWVGSDVFDYGAGGPCTNFYTGSGFNNAGIGLTDVGSCGAGGTITEAQLAAGVINHRLFISVNCIQQATFVYPGWQNGDHYCTGAGPHLPMGALLWSDMTDAQVNALSIPADGKTLLRNLHNYGWFVGDTQCPSNGPPSLCLAHANFNFGLFIEPDVQFTSFGVSPTPIQTYAVANGWSSVLIGGAATRYILCDPCTWVDWRAHLHVLDPCNAKGTC